MQDLKPLMEGARTLLNSEGTRKVANWADRNLGTSLESVGHLIEGGQAYENSKFVSKQLLQQAAAQRAAAGFRAEDVRRQMRFLESRARAVAASGGGSTTDVNVVNALADIAREGEARAMTELYNGKERADGLRLQAAGARTEGRSKRLAGRFRSAQTLLTPRVYDPLRALRSKI